MRLLVTVVIGAATLAWVGAASSASSYADPQGDANTPADISSVSVSGGAPGVVTVDLRVANFRTLPTNSFLTFWFDVDGNPGTGNSDGREAQIRYDASGVVALQLWRGTRLVDSLATGITGSFADGRLTLSIPSATLGLAPTFGLVVVSTRRQPAGNGDLLASDSAPDAGNLTVTGPGPITFADPVGDHEFAPDLGSIVVSDTPDGWVELAISIQNGAALPRAPLIGVSIDADDDAGTGDSGADVAITALGSDVVLDRWNERGRTWVPELDDPKVRVEATPTMVTIGIHRTELGASGRFGFAVLAAGVTLGEALTGVDVAPDGSGFFRYALTNRPDVRLVTGKVKTAPARPRGGASLTVSTVVTRSDTGSPARTGVVTCQVRIDGKRVSAAGRYAGGRAVCSFAVPRKARRIVGTMVVRADGISRKVPFTVNLR